jgi:hypothetical protein
MSWPEVVLALGVLGAVTVGYVFRLRALDSHRLELLESRLNTVELKLQGSGLSAPRPVPAPMRVGPRST